METEFTTWLGLPNTTLMHQRIPKNFFINSYQLKADERKTIDMATNLYWLASIKPQTANIPIFADNQYLYNELQVFIAQFKAENLLPTANKYAQLLQQLIPYPLLLLVYNQTHFLASTAHKQLITNNPNKRDATQLFITPPMQLPPATQGMALFKQINFATANKLNLFTTYQHFCNAVMAQVALQLTPNAQNNNPNFTPDHQTLVLLTELRNQEKKLLNTLKKESQMRNKIQINNQLGLIRNQIDQLTNPNPAPAKKILP